MVMRNALLAMLLGISCGRVSAHDTWVEAGQLGVRQGEYVYVNLMLGNHGNQHRDFRLASKITLAACTLHVFGPDRQAHDLKPAVIDMGSAEKEGFWAARYQPLTGGVHEVVHLLDTLHGTTRAIKSAKTYFVVDPDASGPTPGSLPSAHDHGLELLLHTDVMELAAGSELRLQVLRSGQPVPDARVTFVPRGTELIADFDRRHERTSDADGFVSYVPSNGNIYLAIVRAVAAHESGEGFDRTHYSAAIVLPVPNRKLGISSDAPVVLCAP